MPYPLFDKANEAIVKGDWASAAGFYRWYHEHSRAYVGHGGVRLSFALAYWRVVAEKYPPALADLRDARDRAASKVRAGGHGLHGPMSDLTAIDGVLGDPRVTVDTFAWLRDRRPADAREFASLALPALLAADQAALALPYIDPDEVLRSAQSTMNTFTQARFAPPNQSAEDRLRTAHGIVDGNAAPSVAALVKGGERERAEALVAGLRAMLGPDAALPATVEALGGKAPPFGRFGAAPPLATPPVWTPPEQPDLDALVDTLSELLAWRAEHAPLFRLGEAMVSHQRTRTVTLTSEGSALDTALGSYAVEAMGAARDGALASSFSGAGGHTHDLRSTPAPCRRVI